MWILGYVYWGVDIGLCTLECGYWAMYIGVWILRFGYCANRYWSIYVEREYWAVDVGLLALCCEDIGGVTILLLIVWILEGYCRVDIRGWISGCECYDDHIWL